MSDMNYKSIIPFIPIMIMYVLSRSFVPLLITWSFTVACCIWLGYMRSFYFEETDSPIYDNLMEIAELLTVHVISYALVYGIMYMLMDVNINHHLMARHIIFQVLVHSLVLAFKNMFYKWRIFIAEKRRKQEN